MGPLCSMVPGTTRHGRRVLAGGAVSALRASESGSVPCPVLTRAKGVVDMDERDARHVAEAVWRALQAGDWDTARGYLREDFVQEWP
jgi:hypothetical protein